MKRILYTSIAKSAVGRYFVYALNFLSLIVLARLFPPEAFGVVASIAVFYVFFQVVGEAGIGASIINLNVLEKKDRDGIFSVVSMFAVVVSILFFLSKSFIVKFYGNPDVGVVVDSVSISIIFFILSVLPNAFLLRERRFFSISIAGGLAEIISMVACLLSTRYSTPVEALSIKLVVYSFVYFVLVYYFSRSTDFGNPCFGFKLKAFNEIFVSSGYQFGFNLSTYFSRNLDNIMIGKYYGAESLGFYDRAYQLMRYPLLLLSFSIAPAIQPAIRAVGKCSTDVIANAHKDLSNKLSIIGSVVAFALYFFSDALIILAFGDKWSESIPLFKILVISVGVQVLYTTHAGFFQAMNAFSLLFYCSCINSILTIGLLLYAVLGGNLENVCWAVVCAAHINFFVVHYFLYKKVFKCDFIGFFKKCYGLLCSSLVLVILNISGY